MMKRIIYIFLVLAMGCINSRKDNNPKVDVKLKHDTSFDEGNYEKGKVDSIKTNAMNSEQCVFYSKDFISELKIQDSIIKKGNLSIFKSPVFAIKFIKTYNTVFELSDSNEHALIREYPEF